MPKRPVRRFPDPIPKEIVDTSNETVEEVMPLLALMGKAASEAKALQSVFAEKYQAISVTAVPGDVHAFDVSPFTDMGKVQLSSSPLLCVHPM